MPSPLPLTTGPAAAAAHRLGLDRLAAGDDRAAAEAFALAVGLDPCFAVGHAALVVALGVLGDDGLAEARAALDRAVRSTPRLTRAERHHLEVVGLAVGGRVVRASALGHEHLLDVPDDLVVARALARWCGPPGGSAAGGAVG